MSKNSLKTNNGNSFKNSFEPGHINERKTLIRMHVWILQISILGKTQYWKCIWVFWVCFVLSNVNLNVSKRSSVTFHIYEHTLNNICLHILENIENMEFSVCVCVCVCVCMRAYRTDLCYTCGLRWLCSLAVRTGRVVPMELFLGGRSLCNYAFQVLLPSTTVGWFTTFVWV